MKRPTMRRSAAMTFGVAASMALLGACASLSGVSGASEYACKAPEGITCQSVSGTYANAAADNLASSRKRSAVPGSPAAPGPSVPTAGIPSPLALTTPAGMPLRSSPLILRLWFKPWEDADGDLFDQGHVYVQVNGGRWLVEHAQRAIREAHAPVRAAALPGTSAPPPPAGLQPNRPVNHPTQPALPGRPANGGDARE